MVTISKDQRLSGPHHCASLGRTLINAIFTELKQAAIQNGGTLSEKELLRIESEFTDSKGGLKHHYEETYNFCMHSTPNSGTANFTNENLLIFYLNARTNDLFSELYGKQTQLGGLKWRLIVCHQLGEIFRDTAGSGLLDELNSVYFEIAAEKGRSLSANDISNDCHGNQIIDRTIGQFAHIRIKRPEIMHKLISAINKDVHAKFKATTADDLLMSPIQLESLFMALELDISSIVE